MYENDNLAFKTSKSNMIMVRSNKTLLYESVNVWFDFRNSSFFNTLMRTNVYKIWLGYHKLAWFTLNYQLTCICLLKIVLDFDKNL